MLKPCQLPALTNKLTVIYCHSWEARPPTHLTLSCARNSIAPTNSTIVVVTIMLIDMLIS